MVIYCCKYGQCHLREMSMNNVEKLFFSIISILHTCVYLFIRVYLKGV